MLYMSVSLSRIRIRIQLIFSVEYRFTFLKHADWWIIIPHVLRGSKILRKRESKVFCRRQNQRRYFRQG